MGYYINKTAKRDLPDKGRAKCLIDDCGAKKITLKEAKDLILSGKNAVICVIENTHFDVAGLINNHGEFIDFTLPMDMRKKTFLKMDKELAHKLSGFNA